MAEIKWNNVDGSGMNQALSDVLTADQNLYTRVRDLTAEGQNFINTIKQNNKENWEFERDENTARAQNALLQADSLEALNQLRAQGLTQASAYAGQNIDLDKLNQTISSLPADVLARAESKDNLVDYSPEAKKTYNQAMKLYSEGKPQEAAALIANSNHSNKMKADLLDKFQAQLNSDRDFQYKLNQDAATILQKIIELDATYNSSNKAVKDYLNQQAAIRGLVDETGKAIPDAETQLATNFGLYQDPAYLQLIANKDDAKRNLDAYGSSYGSLYKQYTGQSLPSKFISNSNTSNTGNSETPKAKEVTPTQSSQNVLSFGDRLDKLNKQSSAKNFPNYVQRGDILEQNNTQPQNQQSSILSQIVQMAEKAQQSSLQFNKQTTAKEKEIANTSKFANDLTYSADTSRMSPASKKIYTENFLDKDGNFNISSEVIDKLKRLPNQGGYSQGDKASIAQDIFGIDINKSGWEKDLNLILDKSPQEIASVLNDINNSVFSEDSPFAKNFIKQHMTGDPSQKYKGEDNAQILTIKSLTPAGTADIAGIKFSGFSSTNSEADVTNLHKLLNKHYQGWVDKFGLKSDVEDALDRGIPASYIASAFMTTLQMSADRQGKKVTDEDLMAGKFDFGLKNWDSNDFKVLSTLLDQDPQTIIDSMVKGQEAYNKFKASKKSGLLASQIGARFFGAGAYGNMLVTDFINQNVYKGVLDGQTQRSSDVREIRKIRAELKAFEKPFKLVNENNPKAIGKVNTYGYLEQTQENTVRRVKLFEAVEKNRKDFEEKLKRLSILEKQITNKKDLEILVESRKRIESLLKDADAHKKFIETWKNK